MLQMQSVRSSMSVSLSHNGKMDFCFLNGPDAAYRVRILTGIYAAIEQMGVPVACLGRWGVTSYNRPACEKAMPIAVTVHANGKIELDCTARERTDDMPERYLFEEKVKALAVDAFEGLRNKMAAKPYLMLPKATFHFGYIKEGGIAVVDFDLDSFLNELTAFHG